LAFFHLLAHAIFKALLFLCVGVVITRHGHGQDLRGMGNLVRGLPVVQAGSVLARGALCGVPFLRGFYSKDAILEARSVAEVSWVGRVLFTRAMALTTLYTVRALGLRQVGLGLQTSLRAGSGGAAHFSGPIGLLGRIRVVWGRCLNWLLVPVGGI